jgi:AcrR family transcriptional regulator
VVAAATPGEDTGSTAGADGTATPGRRERKKAALRAAIRDAAMRLSLRDGVENVTLEQIATEADIALRTFFNYFSSKEEAVVAGAAGDFRALIAEFRARPRGESVLQAFREAVLVVMDRVGADSGDHVAALLLIRRERSLVPQLLAALTAQEDALAEAIAERLAPGHVPEPGPGTAAEDSTVARDVYPRLCAATALAALRVTLDRWLGTAPGTGGARPFADLRHEVDLVIAELAAGLDRPGAGGPRGGR